MKKIQKKIFICIFLFIILFSIKNIYADSINENEDKNEQTKDMVSSNLNLDEYVSNINKYVEDTGMEGVDFNDIATSLIQNNDIEYKNIISKVLSFFFKEMIKTLKGSISIFFVIVIMAIISNMELEKKSDITKIANLACFAAIATITIASFIDVMSSFRNVVTALTTLMQTISPFMMAVLISTGAITSTGIVQPMVLFVASAVRIYCKLFSNTIF